MKSEDIPSHLEADCRQRLVRPASSRVPFPPCTAEGLQPSPALAANRISPLVRLLICAFLNWCGPVHLAALCALQVLLQHDLCGRRCGLPSPPEISVHPAMLRGFPYPPPPPKEDTQKKYNTDTCNPIYISTTAKHEFPTSCMVCHNHRGPSPRRPPMLLRTEKAQPDFPAQTANATKLLLQFVSSFVF
jgi:hypothetical protein